MKMNPEWLASLKVGDQVMICTKDGHAEWLRGPGVVAKVSERVIYVHEEDGHGWWAVRRNGGSFGRTPNALPWLTLQPLGEQT